MRFSDVMQLRGTQICVPQITLKKKDRTIILIGMMHTASIDFFSTVRERLLELEGGGFRVLYEFIDPPIPDPQTEEEREWHRRADSLAEEFKKNFRKVGLYYQLDEIPILPSWHSADFSMEDWIRESPTRRINKESVEKFENNPALLRGNIDLFIQRLLALAAHSTSEELSKVHLGRLTNRDKFAARVILDHAKTNNVVTFWGSAHLPGIELLLKKAGYKVSETEWLPVLDTKTFKAKRE